LTPREDDVLMICIASLPRQTQMRQAAIQALAAGWHDDPDTAPLLRVDHGGP
jgi:hypothetical protein